MKLARIVTVSGLSGLTNAYRSVLSATGSLEILGASRWDVTNLFSCTHFLSDKCGETGIPCLDDGLSIHHGDLVAADCGDNWFGAFVCGGRLRGVRFLWGGFAPNSGGARGHSGAPCSEHRRALS